MNKAIENISSANVRYCHVSTRYQLTYITALKFEVLTMGRKASTSIFKGIFLLFLLIWELKKILFKVINVFIKITISV